MRNTLLLVFIHGFKGTDDTFEHFPEHLRNDLAGLLPKLNVVTIVYPQYETRGVLSECVSGFREWLQNKVIDIEVEAGTPSPTIDPSVHILLIGHSMGGIVAAETLLSIASDHQIPATASDTPSSSEVPTSTPHAGQKHDRDSPEPSANPTTLLFPRIQGILAFDTPYLGIHPGVIAHGAEAHYNTASAALNAYNSATKLFGSLGGGGNSSSASSAAAGAEALAKSNNSTWGSYALYAGGIATLAAAGGAAWVNRQQIASGWNWASSHLEFVGCLARGAELGQRVERVVKVGEECKVGFADFYTQLGAVEGKSEYAGKLLGEERTFCVVPKEAKKRAGREHGDGPSPAKKGAGVSATARDKKGTWVRCVNTKVETEISAHRAMFTPKSNSDYDNMSNRAKAFVHEWLDEAWYNKSTTEQSHAAEEKEKQDASEEA